MMRLMTLDRAAEITAEMFDQYVEPLGMSFMSGEVPSVMFTIHRRGSREQDWLAQVRFKNTLTISVFKCEVYLDDVFSLCRRCRLWLITEDVYRIAVLYAMLHPLYQSQYIDFKQDVKADYDSMMAGAGKEVYSFIKGYGIIDNPIEDTVLEILRYHMMEFTNRYYGGGDYREVYSGHIKEYEDQMQNLYPEAYRMARYRKAQTYLIDVDGFIIMEPRTRGGITYVNSDKEV